GAAQRAWAVDSGPPGGAVRCSPSASPVWAQWSYRQPDGTTFSQASPGARPTPDAVTRLAVGRPVPGNLNERARRRHVGSLRPGVHAARVLASRGVVGTRWKQDSDAMEGAGVGITTTGTATQLSVRPYSAADASVVLALINADWLPGQPDTSADMLAEALAGRSQVDAGWWAELDAPFTDVVQDQTGAVLGVVSYAVRSSDGAGLLLWLHCREEQQLAERLVDHVLDRLGARTVFAFEFASALTLGLEGLPVRHRPATRKALEKAGFTGRDLWRYMHTDLPVAGLPRVRRCTVEECEDPPGKRLTVRDTGKVVAEATI